MKAKISRGSGFRGALNYALNKDKGGELGTGNMCGTTSRELAAEFKASRQLRPDCARPVWHCSLSLPAGERLDIDTWSRIAEAHLKKMGFDSDRHQYVVVRHKDTQYDHVHIVASRIGLDGQLWHGKWEVRRAIESTQALEKEFGLQSTPGLENRQEIKPISANEINMAVRTGNAPVKAVLQDRINIALEDQPKADIFFKRLEADGITVRPNIASTGFCSGLSFEYEGIAFKGSQLGKGYSWSGLQKRGLDYEQDRDRKALNRARIEANRRTQELTEKNLAGTILQDRTVGPEHGGLGGRREASHERDPARGQGPSSALERTAERSQDSDHTFERATERGYESGDDLGRSTERVCPSLEKSGGSIPGSGPKPDMESMDYGICGDGTYDAAERICDLAAPVQALGRDAAKDGMVRENDRRLEPVFNQCLSKLAQEASGGDQSVVRSVESTRSAGAVKNQLRAMGCEKYDIGVRDRETGKMMNREWDQDRVMEAIPWLKRMNARGNDIYIRPARDEKHGLVLVDDIDGITIEEMKSCWHDPCCIVETSPKNLQAWVKMAFPPEGVLDRVRGEIGAYLASEYGADKNSADFRHYGRLAGFTNRKPQHESSYGQSPYCLLRDSNGKTAPNGPELIQRAETVIKNRELATEKAHRFNAIRDYKPSHFRNAEEEYKFQMQRLISRYENEIDWSRADWMVCKSMLKSGYTPQEVGKAIFGFSPNIESRKSGHILDYVNRTVNKAMQDKSVQEVLRERNEMSFGPRMR